MYLRLKVLFALMLFCSVSFAADSIKIAVVDINAVFQESSAVSDFTNKVKQKRNDLETEFAKEEDKIKADYEALAKQRGILSEESFTNKLTAINEKARNLELDLKSKGAQIIEGYKSKMNQANLKAKEVISDYSKQKNINLVLLQDFLAYKDKNVTNITKDIASKFNEEFLTALDDDEKS